MKGRPPKSSAELKAAGTFRPERHKGRLENSVKPIGTGDISPPKSFDSEHREKWAEVVGYLAGFGILFQQDYDAIVMYVRTVIEQRKAWERFLAEGSTVVVETKAGPVEKVHPAFMVYERCESILKPLREKFAFTPKDRQSVKVQQPKEDKKDPLEVLMGAKSKVA